MQDHAHSISINSNQQIRNKNDQQQQLKQLKFQVTLSQQDLQSLTTISQSSKFASKVIEFNHLAIKSLENDRSNEALIYLIEAEKILEKAGEKSLEVQKKLIILTLHNLACCYQRNWELQHCSNYLQALIYNLNLMLKNFQGAPLNSWGELKTIIRQSQSSKILSSKAVQLMLGVEIKQRLGRYYLQFCAVNSQIPNHSGALISARKSIHSMKKMFKELAKFLRNYNTRKENGEELDQKLRLIDQISKINDNINISQYEMILQTTKYYLRKWQNSEEKEMVFSEISTEIEAKFRNFSIGSIAQMHPVSYDELFVVTEGKNNELLRTQSILEKVLVLIIGYFTISTELRLMAESKNPISQVSQQYFSSINQDQQVQTREAEIFHLFSIMLASIFIPFQILYMKHILLSYKNHYSQDLFDDEEKGSENNRIYDEFLFTISQIRKGSMLEVQREESLKVSEIEVKKESIARKNTSRKFSNIISNLDEKGKNAPKSKSKDKRKSKSKSKSKDKKSTLKTISALSAHSKNRDKIQPTYTKSPQIHTQPSLSKSKNKKSSLKVSPKITSLQHLAEQNLCTKQRNKEPQKKKHEYAGIKITNVKKKKNYNTIEQTNAYFLKKSLNQKIKVQSKPKSKDSKIKKQGVKGLTPNNPTELYFHKVQKSQKQSLSKSKSKQKALKKLSNVQKIPNALSPSIHNRKSLSSHYL